MLWLGLFAAGVRLAEWLPASLLYGLARPVSRALASLPLPTRRRLRRNLARALGLPEAHPALAPLVRTVVYTQCVNYLDLMRARRITLAEIEARYEQAGPGWDGLLARVRQGLGSVLVTAHFGRIELLDHFLAYHRVPVTLPVERLQPPKLFDLVCALRTRHPTVALVPHDVGLRPCLRALQRGRVVACFSEWDPSGHGVTVRFFGHQARFPQGPAFLALRAGVPLFIGYDLPGEAPGRARALLDGPFNFERTGDIDVDVQAATQHIADHFERYIGRYPGQWVMFHDIWTADVPQSGAPRQMAEASIS